MSVDRETEADVAVVGAGLAGLAAARRLTTAGCRVVVLEARDRVGGRTWSRPLEGGGFVDLGGQWIGPTQDRVSALVAELGLETFPTYADGVPRYSIAGTDDIDRPEIDEILAELDRMAAAIPVDAPWTAEHATEWDGQTLQSWLASRVSDRVTMAFVRLLAVAIFTSEPAELSLLHVLTYIRSAGSLEKLTRDAQERRVVGGAQGISIRLAERLGSDVVWLGSPVERITQDNDRDIVGVRSGDRLVVARRVIVATPIALADRIAYEPQLPAFRAQLHQRMAPGATFKVHCVYDRPFWRDKGLSGRALCDDGFVMVTFDNSPPSGAPGVLVGFIEADEARRFSLLATDARRKAAIDCFVGLFGPDAENPNDYIEMSWSDEEWTRGCYGSNLPPGAWTRYGVALREPFGRVHWAGAETSAVWMNYMEGAVRSGERAASEVLAALPTTQCAEA